MVLPWMNVYWQETCIACKFDPVLKGRINMDSSVTEVNCMVEFRFASRTEAGFRAA
jgi:hypothetical protein